ncbi:hypothetical protein AB0C28_29795 [Nonomuraea sp. NPDC048892]|uniref:hypothetical protein n=1 Tax=Nonomuraea sp. NPDC048892 TaxID=3154624 RepID=UPI0033D77BDF
MADRLTTAFEDALAQAGTLPGDFLRAYVEATIPERHTTATVPADRVTVALLAVMLVDPTQLKPLRERFAAWQARLADDGIDPAAATAIRMAVDGWWAARLLGLGSPGPDLHDGTRRYLMEAIDHAARD